MSAVDLPPGLGLAGTPLGIFHAPAGARRLSRIALVTVVCFGAVTWGFVSRHPYRWHSSTQVVLPIAFCAFAVLGFLVRRARLAETRDGVRWGWDGLAFTQEASQIVKAHVWRDGVTLESKRGSWWFLAARDWERFDVLVRQLRRAELPIEEHARAAPIRSRLQSYGRFLDGILLASIAGGFSVMLWAV